jgi:hypothetical protein
MIAYDLAKELQDAGFPYDLPTLEHLIAACGDDFMSLILWSEPRGDMGRWTADTRAGRARGQTSEEAVARAWLLLNKHKTSYKELSERA